MPPAEPRRPEPHRPGPRRPEARRPEPEGGDPACWVDQVCPACGRLSERLPAGRCAACGQPWDVV